MNILSLFDGCGMAFQALKEADIPVKRYYASEINRFAMEIASKNHEITHIGNILNIDHSIFNVDINLLIGGSPCQGFSKAGGGLNFEDPRSKLFFEYVWMLANLKPKYFLLENVVMKQEWQDIISEYLGVQPVKINSDRFVCQNRDRLYWTNIPIAELPDRPAWNKQYYQWRRTYFRENKSGVAPCLTANMGTGGHNVPLHSKDLKDKLSCNELEELQGLPKDYTAGVSKTQRYKMIGNGFTIPVIAHILKGIK
jgi:DNA (cytosine-5)-methyltransferase 3A